MIQYIPIYDVYHNLCCFGLSQMPIRTYHEGAERFGWSIRFFWVKNGKTESFFEIRYLQNGPDDSERMVPSEIIVYPLQYIFFVELLFR